MHRGVETQRGEEMLFTSPLVTAKRCMGIMINPYGSGKSAGEDKYKRTPYILRDSHGPVHQTGG